MAVLLCALNGALGSPATPRIAVAATNRDPEAAFAALKLAKHYYEKRRYQEAAKLFHEAYQLDPKPEYLYNAARSEQRAIAYDDAERDFRALLSLPGLDREIARQTHIRLAEIAEVRAHYRGKGTANNGSLGVGPFGPSNVPAWTAFATSGLFAAGAATLGVMAARDLEALRTRLEQRADDGRITGVGEREAASASEAITLRRRLAWTCGGAAVVAAGVGVWLWRATPGLLPPAKGTVSGYLTPSGGGLRWSARF
ncbi:MAG: hypothetical protein H6747_10700 [Deltaproteobacteria bacterium]|nr:hypothetical protein [Deltaproteobacteria bacterium]